MVDVSDEPDTTAPISVVIPCYNVAAYICEALDSLMSQSSPPQEVIVIDDGSEDSTGEIVAEYALRLPLTYIRTRNNGQGVARNIGAAMAEADYLYFLDADDRVLPCMLAELTSTLESWENPDVLFFSGISFSEKSFDSPFQRDYRRGMSFAPLPASQALRYIGRNRLFSASPCLYVIRRDFWCKKALYFGNFLHEDEELLYRILLAAEWVAVLDRVYFERRLRYDSTMTMPATAQHVSGRYANLCTAIGHIGLRRPGVELVLRRRALWTVAAYFKMCCRAGVPPRWRQPFSKALRSRAPETAISICIVRVLYQLRPLRRYVARNL